MEDFSPARQIHRKIQAARRREDLTSGMELLKMISQNGQSLVHPEDINAVNTHLTKEKFVNHLLVIAAKKGDEEKFVQLTKDHNADVKTPYRNGKNLYYMTAIWGKNEPDPVKAYQYNRVGQEILNQITPKGSLKRKIRDQIMEDPTVFTLKM